MLYQICRRIFTDFFYLKKRIHHMDKTISDIKADVAQLKADVSDTLTSLGDQVVALTNQVGELKAIIANGGSISQSDLNELAASLETMDASVKAAKPAVTPPAPASISGLSTPVGKVE